jgi:CDP-diacylglycerol--serine O-phosphatidyltransferase
MLRGFHLADFFTLGNAACGVAAVLFSMLYMASQSLDHFYAAAVMAPAALAFAAGMRGGWDAAALAYFVCCGVSRLARYNVTAETLAEGADKVAYFEGTPIPTSVLLSAVLAFAAWQGRIGEALYWGAWTVGPWQFHPLALLFVLSGTLMISKTLRIPKL